MGRQSRRRWKVRQGRTDVKYEFFPGCSIHGTAREYGLSLKAVFQRFGVGLNEIEDWSCCGATAARSLDGFLPIMLGARNLALAQKRGQPLLAPCNLCYNNLAVARHALEEDELRQRVNSSLRDLGLAYSGGVALLHPLQVIDSEVTVERIAAEVVCPLLGLKVVSYYGCLLTRPGYASVGESNFNPTALDRLASALGADPLPFSAKTRCCGGPLLMTHPKAAGLAAKRLLDEARDLGAQCIVVTCPQCQLSLGASQGTIEARYGVKYNIPVLYFTQLLGLALGIDPRALGLPSGKLAARAVSTP